MLSDKKNIHFVGIGGIGMSGIAKVLLEMGYKVSGSDLELNSLTSKIESIGGRVFKGHRPSNISKDTSVLVYSSAVSRDNPEMEEARRRKIKIAHRAEVLAELFNKKKGIAITGTHGKTTTTSLASVMLESARLDPTVIIGGEVDQFEGNAGLGKGEYLVAEADESDSSFIHMKPFYAVITNIEMEHIDHYKSLGDIISSCRSFIGNLKKGGMVFYNRDDANCRAALKDFDGKSSSFGFSADADIYPVDIKMDGFKTKFKCIYKGSSLGEVELNIPGTHNVLNALAVILVGLNMGLKFKEMSRGIKGFRGAKRRFQLRARKDDIMLIDDYAHHPTEIRAVLDTCRNWKKKRLVAIFQPHRYTRTKALADDFGRCFSGVDRLILTDIYAANEDAIKGVSVRNIYDRVRAGGLDDVMVLKKEDIPDFVMKSKRRGDMIVVMGAGNIKDVADELAKRFNESVSRGDNIVKKFKKLVKGKVKIREKLSTHTSFKIGGSADIWVEPKNYRDLSNILAYARSSKTPVFIMGNGSNILASDKGYEGIVISLADDFFKNINIKGRRVHVGAGYSLSKLVRISCENGLGGLESLVGIPGTVGGAIYMNAGGSTNPVFKNIGDLVRSLKVMDFKGRMKTLPSKELKFGYRSSNLTSYVILEAALKLDSSDKCTLTSRCSQFLRMKSEKQTLDMPSAGCVFKNPSGSQFTCGQMIDMLGLKGKRIGGAEVSGKHANFIVNKGGATCGDVLGMIKLIKGKVKSNYGIDLELEIKVI